MGGFMFFAVNTPAYIGGTTNLLKTKWQESIVVPRTRSLHQRVAIYHHDRGHAA